MNVHNSVKVVNEKNRYFGAVLVVEKVAQNGDVFLVGHHVKDGEYVEVAAWFEHLSLEVIS